MKVETEAGELLLVRSCTMWGPHDTQLFETLAQDFLQLRLYYEASEGKLP